VLPFWYAEHVVEPTVPVIYAFAYPSVNSASYNATSSVGLKTPVAGYQPVLPFWYAEHVVEPTVPVIYALGSRLQLEATCNDATSCVGEHLRHHELWQRGQ
jgi:hypothetical protein